MSNVSPTARLDTSVELEVAAAMADREFYDPPPKRVELRESHISRVFIADDRVYKIKKSVVYPFLDYGTLARRRAMCDAEISLNRRLAPTVYVGVRPIVRRGRQLMLGEADCEDEVVEWAVEMRRFPEERAMSVTLAAGLLGPEQVARVGEVLARFHCRAEIADEAVAPSRLRRIVDLDLETIGNFLGDGIDVRAYVCAERFLHAAMTGWQELLKQRASQGLVRDGHGDLRLEHVLLLDDITVVDCVEFDPMLRRIDVGDDLSYLFMELEAAGVPTLAQTLIDAYRRAGGEPGPDALIAFFASYRAVVRAKIALLQAREAVDGEHLCRFRELLQLSERLRWRARSPAIFVLCAGTAGTRSAVAQELTHRSGAPIVDAALVRDKLGGRDRRLATASHDSGDDLSLVMYAEMGRRTTRALEDHGNVIVEAGFGRRSYRNAFLDELGARIATPMFIELRAPLATSNKRTQKRANVPHATSIAAPTDVDEGRDEFAQLDEVHAQDHLMLRADQPVDSLVDTIEAYLDLRLAGTASQNGGAA